MFRLLMIGFTLLLFIPPSHADEFAAFQNNLDVSVEAYGFYWDEHFGEEKLLEETGTLYAAGVIFNGIAGTSASGERDTHRLTFGGLAKLNLGTVDYDGQTQAGDPVKTVVDYLGGTLEGHIGALIRTGSPRFFLEPSLSIGLSAWSRDLNDTEDATGYVENWTNLYTRWGIAFIFPLNHRQKFSFSGGLNLPVWVRNRVNFAGDDDLELSPEGFHPTPFFNAAFEFDRIGLSVFYDAFLFGESDVDYVQGEGYFQPESFTYQAGLRVTFRVF